MIEITPMPIDYGELIDIGYTETCDDNGEVIALQRVIVPTPQGRVFRVAAIRGEDEYGEWESKIDDLLSLQMSCYYAIKNLHKVWKLPLNSG